MAVKFLIFDMDGTLIELKDVHYEAFNRALGEVDEKYVISREEHETVYDGLPTKNKLSLLTKNKGLPIFQYDRIWQRKQDITTAVIEETLLPDEQVIYTLSKLHRDGYKIVVASNSIAQTIRAALEKTNIMDYVEFYLSNEDVKNSKPDPEMFNLAMNMEKYSPYETMIFEDSKYGIQAAQASGAYVYEVKSSKDILYEPIKFQLDFIKDSEGFYR
jgi:HAD superfamily hydrolase (TIGR01509 family)